MSHSQTEAEPQPGQHWAMQELGTACLGDERRTARLIALSEALANKPACSLPEACGDWATTKAAYRFLSNDEIEPEHILAAHRESTRERIGRHSMVLAIQDTTVFNFTTHRATQGLGPISGKKKGYTKAPTGFLVHSCLAVSVDGVPLGLLGQRLWVRPDANDGAKSNQEATEAAEAKETPEAKESARWLAMLETSTEGIPDTTQVLTVADREADIFDFMLDAVRLQKEILVRAKWNRRLEQQESSLRETVEQAPVIGTLALEVTQTVDRLARMATLELRMAQVTLRAPAHRRKEGLPPLVLSAVLAREVNPPADQEPVEWLLLTTLKIATATDAESCVRWYRHRWKIERYHYTLKSGCRIEELQLEDVERLHRALAVYAVVAWRLLYLTYLARTQPTAPCTSFLTTAEWKALHCTIHRTKNPPASPPDLQTAVLWIARLGGFLARKGDGAPGVKVLWRGYRRLKDLAKMWELFNPLN